MFIREKVDAATQALINSLLEQDKKERQQELEVKTYMCAICFGDYGIEEIYILDGCFHRYCRNVRLTFKLLFN